MTVVIGFGGSLLLSTSLLSQHGREWQDSGKAYDEKQNKEAEWGLFNRSGVC